MCFWTRFQKKKHPKLAMEYDIKERRVYLRKTVLFQLYLELAAPLTHTRNAPTYFHSTHFTVTLLGSNFQQVKYTPQSNYSTILLEFNAIDS